MNFKIPKYKLILAIFDFLIIFFCWNIAYQIIINDLFNQRDLYNLIFFLAFSVIIPLIFIFNFQTNNLYKINVFLTRANQLVNIIKSFFYGTLITIAVLFVFNFPFKLQSRYFLLVFTFLTFISFFIYRLFIVKPLFEKLKNLDLLKRNTLIIGAGKSAKLLATKLIVEDSTGVNLIGFADDNLEKDTSIIEAIKVIGKIDEIARLNGSLKIDEAIISIDNISYERLIEIIELYNSEGIFVRVNSELFKTIPENLVVEKIGDLSIINTSPHVSTKYSIIFKNIFDKILAAIGLLFLFPFFLIIAIIIKLTSKGPIFYKQKRIGLNGKEFNFYKFRSMYICNKGVEEDPERKRKMIEFMKGKLNNGSMDKKIINEKRVTPIGKFLRKYSLDELPQLFNVLKGDMSLVGPRPCLPYEYENYEEWQKKRVQVLPGCTGVWQVYGRNKVDFKDSVVMDLYYINNMSPWLDLQLIIKTIPVLLFGKGGK